MRRQRAPFHFYSHMQAPEDQMNKEYAQEWDAAAAVTPRTAAPKTNAVPLKQIVTIRLDTDMLDWFKAAGPGYQTRINQILRQYMAEHQGGQRDDAPASN